jgi:hypothetical protein
MVTNRVVQIAGNEEDKTVTYHQGSLSLYKTVTYHQGSKPL